MPEHGEQESFSLQRVKNIFINFSAPDSNAYQGESGGVFITFFIDLIEKKHSSTLTLQKMYMDIHNGNALVWSLKQKLTNFKKVSEGVPYFGIFIGVLAYVLLYVKSF